MKKIYVSLMLTISFIGYSQFNESAPWNVNSQTSRQNELSIDELKNSFDQYWLSHDKDVKGSGYKPFMRWEYHWRNKVNDQGHLITPQEMWDAWNQKQQLKQSRSALSLPPSNWQPVGPFTHTNTGSWSSGQGRVNFVYEDPNSSTTLYIGTPAGGIWKSIDSGVNWSPLSDELPQIGVSGIAVDHTNSNVIYIATGDKDAGDTYSIGVLKSTDGGVTWNTTGLSFANTSTRAGDIMMHPTNNQILLCATSAGLYKTSNGGTTWSVVQSGSFAQGSIRFKPNDPTTVYAVNYNRFYRSTNTGDSFSTVITGLPVNSGRLILDVTPANANYVYILSATTGNAFQGIYRSTNSGTNWAKTSGTTDVFESTQSWYDLAFAVSDTNADEIYTGCLNVWKSTNGGVAFTKMNNWSSPTAPSYTHADIHYLGFYNGKLFCGSDGGVYRSTNGGTNFTDLTATAQISQFYKIAVAKQTSANIVGGLQDNGGHAYSGGAWKNYYGADGMDAAIDPTNQNLYYGFIQNGSSMYVSNNGGDAISSSVGSPGGASGNWVTPLMPNSQGELFSGFGNLFKLSGGAWVQQNTGSIGSGNLELIHVDPSNDDIMYVANGSGLYKSTNHGVNFSLAYSAPANITSIEVHSSNSSIVYITTSGTTGQVYRSTNGGTSFTSHNTGLPNIGKNIIVHQGRNTDNPLYVGTSLGVYYRDDSMSSWMPFDTNLPNVSVTDLEINLEDAKLIAGTYGRGVWQTDIPVEIPADDVKLVQIQNPTLNINCGTVLPVVEVKNNGTNSISSVTVNYTVDGTPYSYVWNGTLASNATTTIGLPALVLARGTHNLNVTTTITNDAYPDNNSGLTPFYINDAGTVGVVNNFTNTSDELIAYNEGASGSAWERGVRPIGTMGSGGNTVYTSNLTTTNYPDLTKSYLVSQCYDLSSVSNPQISFEMKFDLEQDWDIVYVEYSTNFGASWTVLGTMGTNWYNSDRTQATAGNDCYNCPGAQWTGTDLTLKTYSYPLNSLGAPSNVIFRIVFHSDESVNQKGVNVDDFVITGVLANESFEMSNISVYPNPSNGFVTIAYGTFEPTQIQVYDISGKLILTKENLNVSETNLDLSSASQGIYFIKISSENQSVVKRLIKK
jgi:Secretion system C-terminal sorting domain